MMSRVHWKSSGGSVTHSFMTRRQTRITDTRLLVSTSPAAASNTAMNQRTDHTAAAADFGSRVIYNSLIASTNPLSCSDVKTYKTMARVTTSLIYQNSHIRFVVALMQLLSR